jgi:hypothetical protein
MEESEIEPVDITTIAPGDFSPESWPVQPGDLTVFNPTAPLVLLFPGETRNIDDTVSRSRCTTSGRAGIPSP